MLYIKKSSKSVQEVVNSLVDIAPNYKFGVLHIHNIKDTLNSKGFEFDKECQVLDICNPNIAQKILNSDITISAILPCKLSVYEKNNETFVAMNSLEKLIEPLNDSLVDTALEVEETLKELINSVI